jgi:acetyltransferase
MSIINLDKLFNPKSVALIGASDRAGSVGNVVMRNLLAGSFEGPIFPVNPGAAAIQGLRAYPDVAALPAVPDLAVVCTPPAAVPGVIRQLGERGTRAAVVITACMRSTTGISPLYREMLEAARPYRLRILGPNCIGLLIPGLGLNASFAHVDSLRGKLAFLSQSGALCTTVLDWARARGIGFSAFVSLGDGADVDFGDLLDYLGSHYETRGILLYIESISHARKFLSAARAAARNKKIIVLKSGRFEEGARAAYSHTGALAGRDDVFDAAIRRAGMLRVHSIEDLFGAAETLAYARPVTGRRLAIVTNGGGPGVLAADELADRGGALADLSEETMAKLDAVLPATWSRGNPVDIIGDADARRYLAVLSAIAGDPGYDAILVLLVPTALVDGLEVARSLAAEAAALRKPVLTCWLGEGAAAEARRLFAASGVPTYETPEAAVRAFMQMVDYEENRRSLMQVPPSIPAGFKPRRDAARDVVRGALASGRQALGEDEVRALLRAYEIPVVETRTAASAEAAAACARELGFPVALKIRSLDIVHKSDVGGVVLDLDSESAVIDAARAMLARVKKLQPQSGVDGFTVQRMARRPRALELIAGASVDPVFGPIVLFGAGGTSAEIVRDSAVSLPPLNLALAEQLVGRTRVSRLLHGFRDVPPADLDAVHLTLVKISQMLVDQAEIAELDVNPLLADEEGVLALDARVRLAATHLAGAARLAIRPYPRELEEEVELKGVKLLIRPIRPEDAPAHIEFFRRLSREDKYLRFFRAMGDMPPDHLARFTQLDYDREMALVAVLRGAAGEAETLGVVHATADADNNKAEFAIVVRSDWHGRGLGKLLLSRIIDYCRARGTARLVGETLLDNRAMLGLARRLGFACRTLVEERLVELDLPLQPETSAGAPRPRPG